MPKSPGTKNVHKKRMKGDLEFKGIPQFLGNLFDGLSRGQVHWQFFPFIPAESERGLLGISALFGNWMHSNASLTKP